jgi:FkbM family methyltransferase
VCMLRRMGSMRSSRLRTFIDDNAPGPARILRRVRDVYRASRFRPEPTGLGFSILRGREYANRLVGSELPAFEEHLQRADLFVDIGANVGFFSVLASRAGVRTLAVEPSPLNLKHLRENVRLAGDEGAVEFFPLAVSDADGVVELLGSGQGASLQPGWGGIASNYRTPVRATTLDLILSGREGRLLIKIDVEGHEDAVLRGASETFLRSPRPTWLIEHGPTVDERYAELFRTFWEQGYRVTALPEVPGRAPYPVDPEHVAAWAGMRTAPELMFLCEPVPEVS